MTDAEGWEERLVEKIYVRNIDRMCFWIDARTKEPLGCAFYDAYAFSDPLPVPTMEWVDWAYRAPR